MAIAASSYGSVVGVAALVPFQATGQGDAATFSAGTRPTLAQVESFIDSVSAIANGKLAELGFVIPISDTDVVPMLDLFVNEEVAALVEGVNGSGRFGPSARKPGAGRYQMILDDVSAYLEGIAVGLERLGAARSNVLTAGLSGRTVDERGNATFPLFQRDSFGETFKDWDS